jgi:ribosomal protein S18 acetylase RimI-like enzyme
MTVDDWAIRRAVYDDVPVLVKFNCAIARETEGRELNNDVVTRGVQRGLQRADEVVYYVAESSNGVIGCLMLTREWSDWRDGWIVWVQSVYVESQFRGQGVFRGILAFAMEDIRQNPDVVGIRLYVEENNARAQSVYLRTGFADAHYKVLEQIF